MIEPINVTAPAPLQAFLFESFPQTKKIKIKQWLKFASVLVNGKVIKRYDHELKEGDVVVVRSEGETRALRSLPSGMKIVHEDESIIVIEKPANLLSIASLSEREETAYAHLTGYVRKGDRYSKERIWIVHRLDKETSGLMVFARNEEVKHLVQDNWDKAEKHYLAITDGNPPAEEGVMRSFLDERNPFMVFSGPESEHAREAITHYEVIERSDRYTLLRLKLETGRRHQIRVQLRDMRCAIIGDDKYGTGVGPVKRMCLHSTYLRLPHPVTGNMLVFESPIPDTMAKLMK